MERGNFFVVSIYEKDDHIKKVLHKIFRSDNATVCYWHRTNTQYWKHYQQCSF